MSPQDAPRRTLEDIERLERVPPARRLAVGSTYALLHKVVKSNPERPARCFLPLGGPSQLGEALTTRAFLGKVHQTANLLADLGMGPPDVMALLLPDLLEKELLLWAGQAAGIVCPIPPWLPTPQIGGLLQAAQAKVLVAPSPEVDHELWQKTELVRRQVKSIALVLQVRGPGNEREATYAFNALVEEYPADRLHTGREIAPDDLAVILTIRERTGTPGLVPLTQGNLLYTAWALGTVLTVRQEEVLLRGLSRFIQGGGRRLTHRSHEPTHGLALTFVPKATTCWRTTQSVLSVNRYPCFVDSHKKLVGPASVLVPSAHWSGCVA